MYIMMVFIRAMRKQSSPKTFREIKSKREGEIHKKQKHYVLWNNFWRLDKESLIPTEKCTATGTEWNILYAEMWNPFGEINGKYSAHFILMKMNRVLKVRTAFSNQHTICMEYVQRMRPDDKLHIWPDFLHCMTFSHATGGKQIEYMEEEENKRADICGVGRPIERRCASFSIAWQV